MTPDEIGRHAYKGSTATVRAGRRFTRSGMVSHCSADGMKLYMWPYDKGGYGCVKSCVPVPFDHVLEIKHGLLSTAPEGVKRASRGGVR